MEIVYPVLILTGLAAIFAVVIAICSKKFAVKEDARVETVNSLLAGANCGACGKAGCQDFARALVKGEVNVNDCNATPPSHKREILKILGSNEEVAEATILVVACNGGNKCQDKYDYQGYGDCNSIELLQGGRKSCPSGCIGAGSCVLACPHEAISVKDGVANVHQDACEQCGLCTGRCPKHIIKRIPARAKIYVACSNCDRGKDVRNACTAGCIGCGLCAKVCPSGAITLVENLPVIDYDKCVACGKCVEKCPAKVIKFLPTEETSKEQ